MVAYQLVSYEKQCVLLFALIVLILNHRGIIYLVSVPQREFRGLGTKEKDEARAKGAENFQDFGKLLLVYFVRPPRS